MKGRGGPGDGVVVAEESDRREVPVGQIEVDQRREVVRELLAPLLAMGEKALVVDIECSTVKRVGGHAAPSGIPVGV